MRRHKCTGKYLMLKNLDILKTNVDDRWRFTGFEIDTIRLLNITDEEVLRTKNFGPHRLKEFRELQQGLITLLNL